MNGLSQYIFKQLLIGLVLVTAVLTCVVWLSQSLRFVEMIVSRGVSIGTFVHLTGLMLPNFLTALLPIALAIITTFVYHKMIMDRELVVMQATGLSQGALARPALLLALLLVAFGYWLSLSLVPASYQKFRDLQWDIRYNFSQVILREGTFNEVEKGITVYVRSRTADGQLLGILAHDGRDPDNTYTLMAERGAIIISDTGARVVMFSGNRQDFNRDTKQLSTLYFDRYVFELETDVAETALRYREPRERATTELLRVQDLNLKPGSVGKFQVELHQRLTLPWSALGFTVLALAILISGNFSRRGEGKRVFAVVAAAGAYQAGMLGILNAAAKNTQMIPLIYLIVAVPIVVGLYILLRSGFLRARKVPARSVDNVGAS